MKRRFITTGLVLSLAVAAVGAPKFGSAQTTNPWSTFHGNAARDGLSNAKGPTSSTAAGIWQLAKSVESSPVVDAAGTAYVGDNSGKVYALDKAHPGAPRWTFATGDAVRAAPTLSPDGNTVYAASEDGLVYALKASTGEKLWSAKFGGPVDGSPVVSSDGGTLYDASINGTLEGVKTSDGSILFTRNLNGSVRGNLALSPDGSTLYAGLTTAQVYGIPVGGAGGSAGITDFYLDGPPIGSPAVDPNGNLYITTQAGTLLSFAASNTTLRAGYPFVIPNRAPAATTPAIVNGLVLFGASNGVFYAVNASSAQVQWQVQTAAAIESSAAVAAGNSNVYFGSDDGSIHAVTTAGQAAWTRALGTAVTSSPAIAADGSLWVGSQGGAVYRIQDLASPPPPQTVTPGPSPTPTATLAPVATATPGPTATSTTPATLSLTISASKSVSAGKKQRVTVTSAAGTQVRLRVNYPNGDHQSAKVITDASGHATYSYKQAASKIKHNSFNATIIAKAGTGAGQVSAQARYKIGYGKLDVSAEPRKVAVHRVVNIYVHSKVGKKVAAYLLFPNGKFVALRGTTASNNWARLSYTVPRGVTRGANHKVTVLARLQSRSNPSTKTTFTIK